MKLDWIWQTILIFYIGTFILRVAGRKSISQMTISQTIVMIALGALIIQPVVGRGLLITFLVGFLLSALMIITEYLQVKFDFLETFFSGKSIIVVENGSPVIKNLRKLRLSIDRLETRLRQEGISSIEDVKYATIEINGELGYELKDDKKPLTRGEFAKLMNTITELKDIRGYNLKQEETVPNNIFQEVSSNKFEGDKKEP